GIDLTVANIAGSLRAGQKSTMLLFSLNYRMIQKNGILTVEVKASLRVWFILCSSSSVVIVFFFFVNLMQYEGFFSIIAVPIY
ncbi:hypothetical protein, partial [Planomicrobium okeanokoites]|uniref:hypothetical protein n=1 Tax=Planomicrobium okeanokoites TaxID=244 RepID=UPI00356AD416